MMGKQEYGIPDAENPEWTAEDFRNAKPLAEVFPDLALKLELEQVLAQLRHAYMNLTRGHSIPGVAMSPERCYSFARGLIVPQIKRLERIQRALDAARAGDPGEDH